MKNNQLQEAPIQKISFADSFADNDWIQWVSENGRSILIGFFILILLFFAGYRYTFNGMVRSETQYVNAENEVQRFLAEKNPKIQSEILNKIKTILTNHPELHAKYDSILAEKLMIIGNAKEAVYFATLAIDRTQSENIPFYTSFSKNTLLITENKFEEALKNALNLKANLLKNEDNAFEILTNLNLLRIATLQMFLNEKQELTSWNEWIQYTNLRNKNTFKQLLNHFNIEKIGLINYIESRENFLKK